MTEPYWLDVAAERVGLEHPVVVVHDESIWPRHNAEYRGITDASHRIALAPQVEGWRRVTTLCHEIIHARQCELLGAERFHAECAAERARVGNDIEGVHERQAWEKGAELALTVFPAGYKIVHIPVLVESKGAQDE